MDSVMQTLFDYAKLAGEAGVSADQLAELERLVRQDYGSDEMMIELRLLRTIQAIRDGVLSVDEALAELSAQSPPLRGAG